MPQQVLSVRTGLPQSYLSAIERGRVNCTFETVAILAAALGRDALEFFRR